MAQIQGRISQWNDAKGFGFIKPNDGSEAIFFHISAFSGAPRPAVGMQVSFNLGRDQQNRTRALDVRPVSAQPAFKAKPAFNLKLWLSLAAVVLLVAFWFKGPLQNSLPQQTPASAQYDAELTHTLALIAKGGPYPHKQDGTVFQNREKQLPAKPRGYYREFTVRTPGLKNRGPRRVVTGGEPPEVYYYTQDHYQNFVMLKVPPRD